MTGLANRLPRRLVAALAAPAVVFIAMFYLWPVASLVAKAVTLDSVRAVLHDRQLRAVLWFTTWQALVSTVATIAIGLIPAWLLARYEFTGRRALTALVTVPFEIGRAHV